MLIQEGISNLSMGYVNDDGDVNDDASNNGVVLVATV